MHKQRQEKREKLQNITKTDYLNNKLNILKSFPRFNCRAPVCGHLTTGKKKKNTYTEATK